jgi:K+-transporting ATPase ATPase A chain
MALLALHVVPLFILGMPGIATVLPVGLAGLSNDGPTAFPKSSTPIPRVLTNGSAFAGLNADTLLYNLTLGAAMFAGHFPVIVPVLRIGRLLVANPFGRRQPWRGFDWAR